MKSLLTLFVLTCTVSLAAATAASGGTNNPAQCGGGKLVVNVNYTLVNDYDSGVHGNAWANDTIDRHLQIWQVGTGSYCAVVDDNGSFVTFAGDSPGGTGSVADGDRGAIHGGYTTTVFSGTLDPGAGYGTHGQLGTFDLQCSSAYVCPGAHPTFLSYFAGSPAWDYASWGWRYHTARNGDSTNASAGNSGDIIG